jgi:hypothetical protein
MRTRWGRALGALVGIGIVTTAAAPARASSVESTLALVLGGVVITDIVFATYGISVAGKGQLPSQGWAIAETVFTVPQTVAVNVLFGTFAGKDDDDDALRVLALVPTMGVSILTTHGIWATSTTNVRPGVLAGSSIAVGADIALSTSALSAAMNGHLVGRPMGITAMLLTAPQVATASYLAATSAPGDRAGWIGLGAWSGALFVHGLVSTIRSHGSRDPEPANEPFPAPPPPPLLLPAKEPPPPPPLVPDNRPPLMVPESLRIGPTIVSDGVATAMGIGISGALF